MADDFFERSLKTLKARNRQFLPKLQKPALNAICRNEEEYENAIQKKAWNAMQPQSHLPARITFFAQQATPSAHMDRDPPACGRFYIFRFGSMTLRHMWSGVNLIFGKEHFRHEKTRLAGVERKASIAYRKTIYEFVVNSVLRTGGLAFWRKVSRFQDRYDCFEASYDELPELCDQLTYAEERKSVDIANLHAVEMKEGKKDDSDKRHAFKQFTKMRFMLNCEAAYQFLLNGPGGKPNLWATRMTWKATAQHEQVRAIPGLSMDVQDLPGRPFGQEGQYDRQAVAVADGPTRRR